MSMATRIHRWWTLHHLGRAHARVERQLQRLDARLVVGGDKRTALLASLDTLRTRLLDASPLGAYVTASTPSARAAVVRAVRTPPGFESTIDTDARPRRRAGRG